MTQLTVAELIAILSNYPSDAPINILIDEDYEVAFESDSFQHEITEDGSLRLDICVDFDVEEWSSTFLLSLEQEEENPNIVNLSDFRKA